MILPWGEKTHAVTPLLSFFELSGNTYVVVVYASSPLNLRLFPGDQAQHATLRKKQPPVALERLQALACARVPELQRPVPARTGDQPVNRPRHSKDRIAAIFLTCQFNCSTPLPR